MVTLLVEVVFVISTCCLLLHVCLKLFFVKEWKTNTLSEIHDAHDAGESCWFVWESLENSDEEKCLRELVESLNNLRMSKAALLNLKEWKVVCSKLYGRNSKQFLQVLFTETDIRSTARDYPAAMTANVEQYKISKRMRDEDGIAGCL
jgi:hypothetical protein